MNNDINLFYTEKGTGFPLILLHGNEESSEYFSSQIEYFSQKYRVIAIDTRGHGKSPRGTKPFTLDQFALDLDDFLISMQIEKCHLLGFSDGANIALLFALQHQEKIEKLILNGADLSTDGIKKSVQIPIEIGYALLAFITRFDKNAIAKKEMLGLMVGQPNLTPQDLSVLNIPTLVISGTQDMVKTSHSKLIASSIQNSTSVILNGDHFIAAKNPIEFNKTVEDFLLNTTE